MSYIRGVHCEVSQKSVFTNFLGKILGFYKDVSDLIVIMNWTYLNLAVIKLNRVKLKF